MSTTTGGYISRDPKHKVDSKVLSGQRIEFVGPWRLLLHCILQVMSWLDREW